MKSERAKQYIDNDTIAYQKWRRGANIPMPDPREIGRAIDGAIRELRSFHRLKNRMRDNDENI